MSHTPPPGRRSLRLGLVLAVLVGGAAPADAQLGRLVDRARAAVTGPDASPRRADGAPAPAIDYASLLQTRFVSGQGTFDLGEVALVFPPSAEGREAEFLVRTSSGEVVSRQRLGWNVDPGNPALVELNSIAGVAGDGESPVQAGRYTLDVEVLGDLVGSVPFVVEELSTGDAFNPVTALQLEGPWRTHAFFEHETDRPDYILQFHVWVRPDEVLGDPGTDYESVEVSVRREGREVAWGHATVYSTHYAEWSFQSFQLLTPESRDSNGRFADKASRVTNWTIQDVTPGPYEVVLSTESGPFRTFAIEGAAGAFVPHPRSAIDYEPRARFLTQRRMGGYRNRKVTSAYWIAPE